MVNPIQGLRVNLRAADVANPIEALRNLNIDILDLDRIRGIAEENVRPEDVRTLSGLSSDLEKELIGIFDETRNYTNYLSVLNDGRSAIDGNMTANASVVAASFKFNALAANNTLVSSELSTSRVSAWSTVGPSLYYGAKVTVDGQVELSSLNIDRPIKTRRFESEIPTHKVRITIDGTEYDAYAMKNIPVKLTGYFSSARNIYFSVTNAGSGSFLRPSWVVTDNDTGSSVVFSNRISGQASVRNSIITILGSRAKEKTVEFFYPVSNIVTMVLPNMRLYDFPQVVFPSLTTATLSGSDFKEMPNFRQYAPALEALDVSNINLMRSSDSGLREFNDNVVARLSTTLKRITMNACYAGPASANLAVLSNLDYFVATGDGNTGRRMTGTSPAVNPLKIDTYNVGGNLFQEIHPSVRTSDTLRVLNISLNNLPPTSNVEISATNNVIEQIYANGNRSNFINVAGKSSLKTYYRTDSSATGSITSLFSGCTSLADIRLQNTNITGALPNFGANNPALTIFYAWNTRIQPADGTYVINDSTFGSSITGGCRPTLREFAVSSPLLSGSIQANAMDGLTALVSIFISSTTNGVSGSVPEFRQSGSLRSVNFRLNNMTGTVHSFSFNPNLVNLNLSFNKLSGSVPAFRLSFLTSLILNNNNFTAIGALQCPSLRELNAASCSITTIPDLTNCTALQNIILNSNPMSASAYTTDTFTNLTALRNLNLANCNLSRSDVDRILIDMAKNYDLNPRGRVEVNLTGNESPSQTEEIQTFIISRLRGAGWTIRVS